MTHLFLSENGEYGIIHLSEKGSILVMDEHLDASVNRKIHIHHGRVAPLKQPEKDICLVIKKGSSPTGFLAAKKGEVTDYSLMGTGTLGVAEKCSSPELVKEHLERPLLLATPMHVYFFRMLSIQTLLYVSNLKNGEKIARGWSLFLSISVSSVLLKRIATTWKRAHTIAPLTASPVTLLLRELGYDSIVDETTHLGILFP